MTEAASTTLGLVKFVNFFPFSSLILSDYHLGDAVSIINRERLLAMIDKLHTNIPTVVAIYGAWSVITSDAILDGETAARANLRFIAHRKCDMQPCGD